jgi:hypothetical protein
LALAYYYRGNLKQHKLKDRAGAIEDVNKAATIFQQQRDPQNYRQAIDLLKKIQQGSGK